MYVGICVGMFISVCLFVCVSLCVPLCVFLPVCTYVYVHLCICLCFCGVCGGCNGGRRCAFHFFFWSYSNTCWRKWSSSIFLFHSSSLAPLSKYSLKIFFHWSEVSVLKCCSISTDKTITGNLCTHTSERHSQH